MHMHANDLESNLMIDPTSQLFCLNANLRKASRVILSLYMEEMRESGLSGTQFTLLSAISGLQKVRIGDLARYMSMDQTTVTRNVNLLKKGGYVEVVSGEDRRTRLVRLTKKGQGSVENTYPMWLKVQTEIWNQLGEDRATQLLEITNLITEMAGSS